MGRFGVLDTLFATSSVGAPNPASYKWNRLNDKHCEGYYPGNAHRL